MIKRVGILGGAYDPPHLAHVALAQFALEDLELDVLHVVPTGHAWHKTRSLTSVVDRLAMTRLAFTGHSQELRSSDKIRVDDREARRLGPSYTIDTLQEIELLYPKAKLFLIIGQDQAKLFGTWKDHALIVQKAQVVVACRSMDLGTLSSPPIPLEAAGLGDALHLKCPLMPISATEVRASIEQGLDVSQLVPELVLNYIQQQGLYSNMS